MEAAAVAEQVVDYAFVLASVLLLLLLLVLIMLMLGFIELVGGKGFFIMSFDSVGMAFSSGDGA